MSDQSQPARLARIPWAELSLAGLAVLCGGAVLAASLRHTGSIAFPVDDGYIYSNYVLQAAQGHLFTYNPGETSGGITGAGWYLLCTLSYFLLAPFHGLLGGLGPPAARADAALSAQAVHLYLAAYLPGIICLALTAIGVYRLSGFVFAGPVGARGGGWRNAACWLAGAIAAADLGLVWGALSGLEVALSCALATWAITLLLSETRSGGNLRWSLALAGALPFARPDLLVVGGAGVGWLALSALPSRGRTVRWRQAVMYLLALLCGAALMAVVYYVGWGKPLPSSFYAKVGGLRLGDRFFSAARELVIAGRWLPFSAAGVTLLAGIGQSIRLRTISREDQGAEQERAEQGWAALLLLAVSVLYAAAIMLTLPWFGQEERYLLPIHPFAVVLLVGGAWWAVSRWTPLRVPLPALAASLAALVGVGLITGDYLWATRNYVVEVRNISDAHIEPARWLAANAPPGVVVAAEPIGAVRLFSGRPTVDLVGLTTPATLGTYGNWPRAWEALRRAGAGYLLYYPRWFDEGRPPPWAVEAGRFEIPDNRIAGDSPIAVYRLDWAQYQAGP